MTTTNSFESDNPDGVFEIQNLDGRVWVRPYAGSVEFNGDTFDSRADALAALRGFAVELGWSTFNVTIAE